MKDLANQTSAAAGLVAGKLKEINRAVNSALSGIDTFTGTVREIHENQSSIAGAVEEQRRGHQRDREADDGYCDRGLGHH